MKKSVITILLVIFLANSVALEVMLATHLSDYSHGSDYMLSRVNLVLLGIFDFSLTLWILRRIWPH